jgi:hypothetical protein
MKRLVVERLRDWSYGAFLNETDSSCIAIGNTEKEARANGERELARRVTGSRWSRYIDFMADHVINYPLDSTEKRSRPIRLLGLVWFMTWVLPVAALLIFPILFCAFAEQIEKTWNGVL